MRVDWPIILHPNLGTDPQRPPRANLDRGFQTLALSFSQLLTVFSDKQTSTFDGKTLAGVNRQSHPRVIKRRHTQRCRPRDPSRYNGEIRQGISAPVRPVRTASWSNNQFRLLGQGCCKDAARPRTPSLVQNSHSKEVGR